METRFYYLESFAFKMFFLRWWFLMAFIWYSFLFTRLYSTSWVMSSSTTQVIYLFNRRKQGRTLATDGLKWHRSKNFAKKNICFTYYMTEHKQKSNKFPIFLICIPFLLVLGYLLVEWFSLMQSSVDGVEVDRCSLLTYLGQTTQVNNHCKLQNIESHQSWSFLLVKWTKCFS